MNNRSQWCLKLKPKINNMKSPGGYCSMISSNDITEYSREIPHFKTVPSKPPSPPKTMLSFTKVQLVKASRRPFLTPLNFDSSYPRANGNLHARRAL